MTRGVACSPGAGAELALSEQPGCCPGESVFCRRRNLSYLPRSCTMFCQCDQVTHQILEEFLPLTWSFQCSEPSDPQLKCLCKLFLQQLPGSHGKGCPDGFKTSFFCLRSQILYLGLTKANRIRALLPSHSEGEEVHHLPTQSPWRSHHLCGPLGCSPF